MDLTGAGFETDSLDYQCATQESKLAVLWNIGIFALNFGPVVFGPFLDLFGPKLVAMFGAHRCCTGPQIAINDWASVHANPTLDSSCSLLWPPAGQQLQCCKGHAKCITSSLLESGAVEVESEVSCAHRHAAQHSGHFADRLLQHGWSECAAARRHYIRRWRHLLPPRPAAHHKSFPPQSRPHLLRVPLRLHWLRHHLLLPGPHLQHNLPVPVCLYITECSTSCQIWISSHYVGCKSRSSLAIYDESRLDN